MLAALLLMASTPASRPAHAETLPEVNLFSNHQAASGTLELSSGSIGAAQASGRVTVAVMRAAGSAGEVSVAYSTANGTAKAGSDYTKAGGTLTWAKNDTSTKSFTVAVSTASPFAGTRSFTIALSDPTGGAALGSPGSSAVTITGSKQVLASPVPPVVVPPVVVTPPASAQCARSSGSWVSNSAYAATKFGDYTVENNNWNSTPGQVTWGASNSCWGVTTNSTAETYDVHSAPGIQRGWTQNCTMFDQLGGAGWTAKSGMGIQVSALTKAQVHWAFTAPAAYPASRWNALIDTYFWSTLPTTCAGNGSEFNAKMVDLMVDQQINDQVLNGQSFYAQQAAKNHATTVTISGSTYLTYVDNPSQVFNAAGGHTIEMFLQPTGNFALWGSNNAVTDLAAIVKFWSQPNPVDDKGKPILYGNGSDITTPVISMSLYMGEIYAAFEQDFGTPFETTDFCIAMQNEANCG